jgi:hypothetical protein
VLGDGCGATVAAREGAGEATSAPVGGGATSKAAAGDLVGALSSKNISPCDGVLGATVGIGVASFIRM